MSEPPDSVLPPDRHVHPTKILEYLKHLHRPVALDHPVDRVDRSVILRARHLAIDDKLDDPGRFIHLVTEHRSLRTHRAQIITHEGSSGSIRSGPLKLTRTTPCITPRSA